MRVQRWPSVGCLIGLLMLSLLPACSRIRKAVTTTDADGGGAGDNGGTRRELQALIAEQLDADLQFSPTLATWLGDHTSDDRLDDVRLENIAREVSRIDSALHRLSRLRRSHDEELNDAQRLDAQLLQAHLESKRHELFDLRPHEKNPVFYTSLIAFGLDGLMGPGLMSVPGLRALRGRLSAVPAVCREAQRNLKNPPDLATKRAIDMAQMTRDFVALLLPRVLANISVSSLSPSPADATLLEEVNQARESALHALDDLGAWMTRDLLPRSKGDWVLGRERLQARWHALELLDVPLDEVQSVVEVELREVRRRFDEANRRVLGNGVLGPSRASTEAIRVVEEDHPKPDELLRATDAAIERAYELTGTLQLLSIPPIDEVARPQAVEMPAYRYGFLLLSAPAPLEPLPWSPAWPSPSPKGGSQTAQLFVDPVDPSWKDKKRISDHLRMLNRSQILLTALHEVMPGHYAQLTALRRLASGLGPLRLRRQSTAFLEGWTAYAEQLVAVELAGSGAAADRLQVLALRAQMLRLARLLGVLRLHAAPAGASSPSNRLEDVVRLFSDDCYLDDYVARREAERLCYDTTPALAALGYLQLAQLRSDHRAEHGDKHSALAFHDAVLSQGALPIVALRKILLGKPGPSLRPPSDDTRDDASTNGSAKE
ncbi:MAG: DUF885 domain-containing protein [Myxococcales bacterium]|nr:DUF885 domain-containing protein [Myxococcales bacterium]